MNDAATPRRSKREELLLTLSKEQLSQVTPVSESTIRRAIELGQADAEAARTAEQTPTIEPSLRFR